MSVYCYLFSVDFFLFIFYFFRYKLILITVWNDKIAVLKKATLQLYFKIFIEKINSGNLIM